ncbi:indole-3-glycerol phosphate synthase [Lachnospiraceae bacterium NE2001]|nr:indole-3-glycerol phosphate synthase [Lachnospiraceae bacterium NE2001]
MILDELAELTRIRIEKQKLEYLPEDIRSDAEMTASVEYTKYGFDFPFEKALKKEGLSIISEVKKASPSKGVIAEDFPYLEIAKTYEESGADAISCLTEPDRFKGSDEYLKAITKEVKIPVLRKDFTIDPYMIYQAKLMGASAVLLIAAILSDEELKTFFEIADGLGLSCLFEAHDAEEVKRCLAAGARIVGVNNRNLKDFTVDIKNSIRLRGLVPGDVTFVSESGIEKPEDVKVLREKGTDAVLIGEMLMRSSDKKMLIQELKKNGKK